MIVHKTKEVQVVYYGRIAVQKVMYGAYLIWQAVRSCFGLGCWVNEMPWDNTDGWKNNA